MKPTPHFLFICLIAFVLLVTIARASEVYFVSRPIEGGLEIQFANYTGTNKRCHYEDSTGRYWLTVMSGSSSQWFEVDSIKSWGCK